MYEISGSVSDSLTINSVAIQYRNNNKGRPRRAKAVGKGVGVTSGTSTCAKTRECKKKGVRLNFQVVG